MMNEEKMTLGKNHIATIQRCEHGVVHIHFGCFSVRLMDEAFIQFASAVQEASSRLLDLGLERMLEAHEAEEEK